MNSAANEFRPTNLAAPAALDEFAARRRETIEEHCARTELDRPTCDRLKALDRRVSQSRGAITAPAEMQAGEAYTVTVAVAEAGSDRSGASDGNAATPASDGRRTLGHFERVELTGSGVDIRPLETGTRDLDAAGRRTWTWQVTPQGNGSVQLRADVIPVARTGDGRFVDLPGHTLDTLQVEVGRTWGGWFGSAKILIAALVAVVLALGLGQWRWTRRGARPE